MRSALTLMLALSIPAAAPAADHVNVVVEAFQWAPDPSGTIRVIDPGVDIDVTTDIDLEGDLGLTGDEIVAARLTFHPSPRTRLRLATMPLSFAGDQTVTRSITFGGQTFTLSERITSQLDLDYIEASFAWQFLSSDDRRFRIGPTVGIKGFDGDASLAAPDADLPLQVSESFEAGFGAAGIALDLEPSERIHLYGDLSVVVGADEGDLTDLDVGVRVRLFGPLVGVAGLRTIDLEVEDGNDRIDFELDEVYFGAGLSF